MPTDGQSLERKRENYKRSQTLAALPIFKVRTDHRDGAGSSTGAPGGVMGRSSAASSSTTSVGSTTVEGSGRRSLSGGNVSAHNSDPVVPLRGAHFSGRHSHDKEESVKKHSLIPGSRRDTGTGVNPHSTKRLGRTPSSPSVLFYKVKERIREKVVEASTEWPHMAAIVQERRQRAADAFEARMSIRRQKGLHGGSMSVDYDAELQPLVDENSVPVTATTLHKARRIRIWSDPASHHRTSSSGSSATVSVVSCSAAGSFDKESAKSAFRRRSISDDTYNMQQRSSTGSSVTGYGSGVGMRAGRDRLFGRRPQSHRLQTQITQVSQHLPLYVMTVYTRRDMAYTIIPDFKMGRTTLAQTSKIWIWKTYIPGGNPVPLPLAGSVPAHFDW